ncbi:MAG: tRNA (N(6)-L-threonylcarbamoyladenosine(37)-C(2))-methylthiotransferase [Nanoarchaeota archaeon]
MENIYIKTYGCSLNVSDSERIAGVLEKAGFNIVGSEEEAVLVIVNTCIVKEPSQETALSHIRQLKEKGKKVVVAGCLPQGVPEKLENVSMIGVDQLQNIVEVVEETLNGNSVVLIARGGSKRYSIPRKRKNKIIEILPIATGCLGNCSYCIVKRARGDLSSIEKSELVNYAQKAIREGAKELWITAQDTGCYGKDIGTSLPELLKELIALRGDYWIRLGMMNPNFALEYIDELIEIFKSPNMFRFVHIPFQSANNEVLEKMNRPYKIEDFINVVKRLKNEFSDMTLATDVICGFPGESEEKFRQSIDLVNEIKPNVLNISRYWKRPYTEAAKLKQLPTQEIKSRSRRMTALFEWIALENNKKWMNWEGEVLVDEKGKNNTWIARNYAYKPIILEGDYEPGEVLRAKIIKTAEHDLRAIEIGR